MSRNNLAIAAIIALLCSALAFLYIRLMHQEAQLRDLTSTHRAGNKEGKQPVDPYISGPVKNRILKGYADLNLCYKTFLGTKPSKTSGKAKIDWQINTNGKVIEPQIVFSDFSNSAFENCMTAAIAAWRFVEPSVQKYIEHTFLFEEKQNKNR